MNGAGVPQRRVGRSYSVRSQDAFGRLQGYEEKLRYIQQRHADLMEGAASLADLDQVGLARSELGQLNGELEKLQLEGIDSVAVADLTSGKEQARAHRKKLNAEVEDLLPQMFQLKKRLDERAAQLKGA